MEGPWLRFRRGARASERHRTVVADSLKTLDPKRPIRKADIADERQQRNSRPKAASDFKSNDDQAAISVAFTTGHKAQAYETEEHHRPGGRFGNGWSYSEG